MPRITINTLWPNDGISRHRSGSTLAQVMACCLMSPSHYTRTNVDLSSVRSNGIRRRAISQEIPKPPITDISLEIAYIIQTFIEISQGPNEQNHASNRTTILIYWGKWHPWWWVKSCMWLIYIDQNFLTCQDRFFSKCMSLLVYRGIINSQWIYMNGILLLCWWKATYQVISFLCSVWPVHDFRDWLTSYVRDFAGFEFKADPGWICNRFHQSTAL